MAEQSRRFVSLDKPTNKFIEDQKNKNTLSKTRRDVSLLTEFLNSKSESRKTRKSCQKSLMNISVNLLHLLEEKVVKISSLPVYKRANLQL